MQWTREIVTLLIHELQEHECLYKVNCYQSKTHKDNASTAINVLIEKLKLQFPAKCLNLDPNTVKQKIKSLKDNFRKTNRKIAASASCQMATDIYQPTLWYYNMMKFLCEDDKAQDSTSDYEPEYSNLKDVGKLQTEIMEHCSDEDSNSSNVMEKVGKYPACVSEAHPVLPSTSREDLLLLPQPTTNCPTTSSAPSGNFEDECQSKKKRSLNHPSYSLIIMKTKSLDMGVIANTNLPCGLILGDHNTDVSFDPENPSQIGDDDVLCTSEKDPLRLEEDFDSTPRDWQNYTISCEDVRQVNLVAFMNLSKMYYITIKSVLRGSELIMWTQDSRGTDLSSPTGEDLDSLASAPPPQPIYCIAEYLMGSATDSSPDTLEKRVEDTNQMALFPPKPNISDQNCYLASSCVKVVVRNAKVSKLRPQHKKHVCELCEYSCSSPNVLRDHMRIHTGDFHRCADCDYRTPWLKLMTVHRRRHTGDLVKCPHCDYKTGRKGDLRTHMQIHTGKTFKCSECDYATSFAHLLKAHMRKHTGDYFRCDLCDFTVLHRYRLKEHMLTHMNQPDKVKIPCQLCDKKLSTEKALKDHMRKQHTGDLFKCLACDFTSNTRKSLKEHKLAHADHLLKCEKCDFMTHLPSRLKVHKTKHTEETYNCNQCDFSTNFAAKQQAHMLTAHNRGLLQCEDCDYQSLSVTNFRRHRLNHANEPFQCGECEFQAKSYYTLQTHLTNIHKKGFSWQCHLCDFKTIRIRSREGHMRKHTGDLLECPECDYKTSSKPTYNEHMRIHSGDLFHCKFCEFKTPRKEYLKVHIRKHTGEKYQCHLCDYNSIHSSAFKYHLKKHSGDLIQCNFCSYETPRKSHLKKHMNSMHKNETN